MNDARKVTKAKQKAAARKEARKGYGRNRANAASSDRWTPATPASSESVVMFKAAVGENADAPLTGRIVECVVMGLGKSFPRNGSLTGSAAETMIAVDVQPDFCHATESPSSRAPTARSVRGCYALLAAAKGRVAPIQPIDHYPRPQGTSQGAWARLDAAWPKGLGGTLRRAGR